MGCIRQGVASWSKEVDTSPLLSLVRHISPDSSVLGFSVLERHGITGVNPVKGHKVCLRHSKVSCKERLRAVTVQPGEEKTWGVIAHL